MPGRFSGGRRPVVTAGALAGDAGMVECGRGPAAGRMALVAIIGAGDVVCGFSGGRGPVVATDAGAKDSGVVDIGNQAHGHRGVAIVTLFGRTDVIAGLRGRRHESTLFVAVGTVLRRSLKDALDMTLLTGQLFVGARERKPGREMVKLARTLLGLGRSDTQHRH